MGSQNPIMVACQSSIMVFRIASFCLSLDFLIVYDILSHLEASWHCQAIGGARGKFPPGIYDIDNSFETP